MVHEQSLAGRWFLEPVRGLVLLFLSCINSIRATFIALFVTLKMSLALLVVSRISLAVRKRGEGDLIRRRSKTLHNKLCKYRACSVPFMAQRLQGLRYKS